MIISPSGINLDCLLLHLCCRAHELRWAVASTLLQKGAGQAEGLLWRLVKCGPHGIAWVVQCLPRLGWTLAAAEAASSLQQPQPLGTRTTSAQQQQQRQRSDYARWMSDRRAWLRGQFDNLLETLLMLHDEDVSSYGAAQQIPDSVLAATAAAAAAAAAAAGPRAVQPPPLVHTPPALVSGAATRSATIPNASLTRVRTHAKAALSAAESYAYGGPRPGAGPVLGTLGRRAQVPASSACEASCGGGEASFRGGEAATQPRCSLDETQPYAALKTEHETQQVVRNSDPGNREQTGAQAGGSQAQSGGSQAQSGAAGAVHRTRAVSGSRATALLGVNVSRSLGGNVSRSGGAGAEQQNVCPGSAGVQQQNVLRPGKAGAQQQVRTSSVRVSPGAATPLRSRRLLSPDDDTMSSSQGSRPRCAPNVRTTSGSPAQHSQGVSAGALAQRGAESGKRAASSLQSSGSDASVSKRARRAENSAEEGVRPG